MSRLLLLIFLSLSQQTFAEQTGQKNPDFSGFTRSYLVSLTPAEVKYIHKNSKNGAHPNYNWSMAFGPTSICTMSEVENIRDALGATAFEKYGEYIDFGWLYEQKEFEYSLRKFLVLLKKDKSPEARVIQHVVEKALHPENITLQKNLIAYELEKNEKLLSEKSGLSREKSRELAMNYSRRFNSCLGRYQTGYLSLTLHLLNH